MSGKIWRGVPTMVLWNANPFQVFENRFLEGNKSHETIDSMLWPLSQEVLLVEADVCFRCVKDVATMRLSTSWFLDQSSLELQESQECWF